MTRLQSKTSTVYYAIHGVSMIILDTINKPLKKSYLGERGKK